MPAMPVVLFAATVLLGLLLLYGRLEGRPPPPLAGLAHRALAGAALALAWVEGATLLWAGALVVAACGLGAARWRNEVGAIMCLVGHVSCALTLLVAAALTRG